MCITDIRIIYMHNNKHKLPDENIFNCFFYNKVQQYQNKVDKLITFISLIQWP